MARRAYCPLCGKSIAVRVDGTLRRHGDDSKDGRWCAGWGSPGTDAAPHTNQRGRARRRQQAFDWFEDVRDAL